MSFKQKEILGYSFKDASLLQQALTHPSFLNEARGWETPDYQRLEFLGDAVLSLCLADILFNRYQDMPEGELSRLRASLVDQPTLAEIATLNNIGAHAMLGKGEERDGGRNKPSILSDVLEAILGAIYLDGGLQEAKLLISNLYSDLIERPLQSAPPVDPKSELQEALAASGKNVPMYSLLSKDGPAHAPVFRFSVSVDDLILAEGEGNSKKAAQQAAAMAALCTLKAEE